MPAATNVLLLTPTPRLARSLARSLAAEQTAAGRSAWLPPRVRSFAAWQSELRETYLLGADDPRVPIDNQQALLLWQSLVDCDVFIGEPRVAELALRAWRLIHEYQLDPPERWPALLLSEDSLRFREWAERYRARCARQGLVDDWAFAAELPGLFGSGAIAAPDELELVGFDLPMTPLQSAIIAAVESAGIRVTRRAPAPPPQVVPAPAAFEIRSFVEPDDEILAAARWARARLEGDPRQQIAVVVPDLGGRLERVERLFRQVFDPPGHALAAAAQEPWHVSLGKPLAQWPLVADALAVLQQDDRRLTQPQAMRLLRSPFLAGWADEAGARDRAVTRLARDAPYHVTASELRWIVQEVGAHTLAHCWAAWQAVRRDAAGPAWPSQWAARFQQELSALGFGSGRGLDSREYQVLQRWHDLLEAFSALDVVAAAPMPRTAALAALAERASGAVFREQNPGVPVEVLGVEEALGSQFDAMWVTTLDSDTWPGPARRDPLIPAPLQATVPRATSAGSLAQARCELTALLASAPAVAGSFARGRDAEEIEVTALLAGCPVHRVDPPAPPLPAPLAPLIDDARAPPLGERQVKGGTGVLRHQSDCPFRAFAERRLGARDLTPPRPGLDAAQRGNVIHKALEELWLGLSGRAALAALSAGERQVRISSAVTAALEQLTARYRLILSAAGRRLEQQRVERVLARWLDVELERSDFTVISHERAITLRIGGLTLTGKIDRVDELPGGDTLLIDYKTGRNTRSDWAPGRDLVDPQLPAYALAMEPQPAGIAFARIRPDELRFDGLAGGDLGTRGIADVAAANGRFKGIESWPALLEGWRARLETLAGDFLAGRADVAPRKPVVCRHCHLHALCRIHERAPYAALEDAREEDGEGPDDPAAADAGSSGGGPDGD